MKSEFYNDMFDIIICCYNSDKNIKAVLDSITNQEHYKSYINKLICVDNNSTDNTVKILSDFQSQIENLLILTEPKQGLSYARKKGVDNSESEWLIFVDDDNIVSDNWFQKARDYILKNEQIGAFNGSVIPMISEKLSIKEQINLELSYKALACTHLKESDINLLDDKHPNGEPFGAGLVIRGNEMRSLSKKGWLKSTGRLGNKIISGEDGEMIDFIKLKYQTGYNPHMLIKHKINKNRLANLYLENLYKSFYEYYKLKKSTHLLRFIKIYLRTKKNRIKFFFLKQKKSITYRELAELKFKTLF